MNKAVAVLLFVLFVVFVVFFWPTSLGGDTSFLLVFGESMLPTIQPGSLVVIKKQPSYQIDDIIAYSVEGPISKNIVHRIIGETNQGFVIKGDNNQQNDDGYWPAEKIMGRVIFATPYIGDVLGLFRNPIFMLVSSIVVFVVDSEQKRRKKRKERIRRLQLGLPLDIKKEKEINQKKPKKPDYRLFVVAIIFNIITYAVIQISLSYSVSIQGDTITGFLYKVLEPYNASTISFALYFLFILVLYYSSKAYEKRMSKKIPAALKDSKSMNMLVGRNFNPVLLVTQFLLVLFIIMSLFHLFSIGAELIEVVS